MEDVKFPKSCTILIKGPNEHTIAQLKDAVRDGMRAVQNVCEDEAVVPGGGAWEIAAAEHLVAYAAAEVTGKAKLGVLAFADALLVVPKTLAENSGFDVQDVIIKVQEERARTGLPVGVDVTTGKPMLPEQTGVWDALRVKKQVIQVRQRSGARCGAQQARAQAWGLKAFFSRSLSLSHTIAHNARPQCAHAAGRRAGQPAAAGGRGLARGSGLQERLGPPSPSQASNGCWGPLRRPPAPSQSP